MMFVLYKILNATSIPPAPTLRKIPVHRNDRPRECCNVRNRPDKDRQKDNMLTHDQMNHYLTEGFVTLKGFLNPDEISTFREIARTDLERDAKTNNVIEKGDKSGNTTLLKMWYEANDDIYGYVARDERLVNIARQIIGKDTYLYSHKMTMKQPRTGGAWEWHQDFGYWYQNKCLAAEMLSIWISLDSSVKENGCLQVLPRSHKLGRLDHIRINDQTVVDEEYLNAAIERFDLLYVEMEPGDALVFDGNLLHRSDANTSDTSRWGYIASYNAVENAPFRNVREYGHFQEMKQVPAGKLLEAGKLN